MRIGTRGSKLARWQANHVAARLVAAGHEVTIDVIETEGDAPSDGPLRLTGDDGQFTRALDAAVLDGRVDLAVHALEDLPATLSEGLTLAAVSARATPWDAFVAHPDFEGRLTDLPTKATLAVSSLRQQAQLRAWRSDLQVVPVRGPVAARLQRLRESGTLGDGGWHGIVLAEAALRQLALDSTIRDVFAPSIVLPGAGQGALGVVCLASNPKARTLLVRLLDDDATRITTGAERAFRQHVSDGGKAAVGAYARLETGSVFVIDGVVADADGTRVFRGGQKGTPSQAQDLARALAGELLARGGREVLSAARTDEV
ncbi:MAG: hydroxymethylbilane synthase [Bacteroidota bacterium]